MNTSQSVLQKIKEVIIKDKNKSNSILGLLFCCF